MSILTNDIFDKIITIGDRYYISMLRVNCPYYTNFCPDLEKVYPFRGIDYISSGPSIKAIEEQITKEVLEAPITKVQYTTQRYAHIKRCIKKHIYFDAYRCQWETSWSHGPSWKEPAVVHVTCKYPRGGEWVDLIKVSITLKDEYRYNEPF